MSSIVFDNVTKYFSGETPALDQVSFVVDPGELLIVTGKSGSGKTTLMRLLTREHIPDQGEVLLGETTINRLRGNLVPHHRRRIGVVFQDYKLLPELNIWENIALALTIIGKPTKEIEQRVTDLLKLVNLVDKAFLFPHQISGDEAQRVSIARALSTAPEVIFADEPTGNLDSVTSESIITLLKKINELGTTTIITTHDPIVIAALKKHHHLELSQGKITYDSKSKHPSSTKTTPKKTAEADAQAEMKIAPEAETPPPDSMTQTPQKTRVARFFQRLFSKKPPTKKTTQSTQKPSESKKESSNSHPQP